VVVFVGCVPCTSFCDVGASAHVTFLTTAKFTPPTQTFFFRLFIPNNSQAAIIIYTSIVVVSPKKNLSTKFIVKITLSKSSFKDDKESKELSEN